MNILHSAKSLGISHKRIVIEGGHLKLVPGLQGWYGSEMVEIEVMCYNVTLLVFTSFSDFN